MTERRVRRVSRRAKACAPGPRRLGDTAGGSLAAQPETEGGKTSAARRPHDGARGPKKHTPAARRIFLLRKGFDDAACRWWGLRRAPACRLELLSAPRALSLSTRAGHLHACEGHCRAPPHSITAARPPALVEKESAARRRPPPPMLLLLRLLRRLLRRLRRRDGAGALASTAALRLRARCGRSDAPRPL